MFTNSTWLDQWHRWASVDWVFVFFIALVFLGIIRKRRHYFCRTTLSLSIFLGTAIALVTLLFGSHTACGTLYCTHWGLPHFAMMTQTQSPESATLVSRTFYTLYFFVNSTFWISAVMLVFPKRKHRPPLA